MIAVILKNPKLVETGLIIICFINHCFQVEIFSDFKVICCEIQNVQNLIINFLFDKNFRSKFSRFQILLINSEPKIVLQKQVKVNFLLLERNFKLLDNACY